jgi:hypothetical protein
MSHMCRIGMIPIAVLLALPVIGACQEPGGADGSTSASRLAAPDSESSVPALPALPVEAAPLPGHSAAEAARAAWSYMERNWQDGTGLVTATEEYPVITSWDMGSILAGLYSAHRLGLISQLDYGHRMEALLETLGTMDLYDGVAFNKAYDARTGRMVDRRDRPTDRGYGWSVLDVGRILSWLKIVEQHSPQHAPAARRVVERLDFDRLIEDGYLMGGNLENGQTITYVEGRIGYEQYAAEAFARWGHPASRSADLRANTRTVDVLGYPVATDTRGRDRLTSEPFVLLGLELGWSEPVRGLAMNVLGAQRARYEETGTVTMASEDAMTEAPHYFYYYAIVLDEHTFVIDAQGARSPLDGPRWVSAKASYGWHALLPDDYTALAVETVGAALDPERGWFSGVYEGNGRRAGAPNINTAGVILSTMLYRETGLPLIEG